MRCVGVAEKTAQSQTFRKSIKYHMYVCVVRHLMCNVPRKKIGAFDCPSNVRVVRWKPEILQVMIQLRAQANVRFGTAKRVNIDDGRIKPFSWQFNGNNPGTSVMPRPLSPGDRLYLQESRPMQGISPGTHRIYDCVS